MPTVLPSMVNEFDCPLNTCTPVESPNALYIDRRPVNLTFSATSASMLRRSRLV